MPTDEVVMKDAKNERLFPVPEVDLDVPVPPTSVEALFQRLEHWLVQQKEYPLLFTEGRQVRRAVARALSYRIMTLPTREPGTARKMNRQQVRKIQRALRHAKV